MPPESVFSPHKTLLSGILREARRVITLLYLDQRCAPPSNLYIFLKGAACQEGEHEKLWNVPFSKCWQMSGSKTYLWYWVPVRDFRWGGRRVDTSGWYWRPEWVCRWCWSLKVKNRWFYELFLINWNQCFAIDLIISLEQQTIVGLGENHGLVNYDRA